MDILDVLMMICSEAANRRAIQVLAETGGAVSALTSEGHVWKYQQIQLATGSGKARRLAVLLATGEKRMGLMELAVLFLKLMVALLQLLEVAMKYFK